VSFPLRLVVEVVPPSESEAAARTRAEKYAWLTARDYNVLELPAHAVETDLSGVLERIVRATDAVR
jgi:tRNA/rRNA methyltransferase